MLAIVLSAGPALGADLATAQKQWEAKQFSEAFRNFKVLAEGGESAAQLQLGEMYGFGEGTAEDPKQAEFWLNKALAAGQAEAKNSLALVQQRQRMKADIAAYTHNFTGQQLAYGSYGCVRPSIPEHSSTNADIARTNEAINKWRACYETFATRLNGALPVTNTIPPDIINVMNNDEFQRASTSIETVYARLAAEGQAVADQVAAENKSWADKTVQFADKTKTDKEVLMREFERITRDKQNIRANLPSGK
ncbi:hypothetical protein OU994_07595 [Pseudoduganella sp. SL102]|uniref:tetratricopeptide repeat protein n=1 Tax=Pseudoduganella sp. SL102 TaxID=2995154 RepID=UPI00248C9869|nr:hypothetical protein [Pseudoduganella sp. SL102]WBS04138.1 hypothetical protein OU994_07595 [Pseudoduganella sp. SL102]